MRSMFDKTLLRFLLVGVINTLVGAGSMFLLYNLIGCSYWLSSAANYLTGGIVSYFLNKYFTFENKERSFTQVLLFAGLTVLCWLIAYGVAKPVMLHLLSARSVIVQENSAMLVGMVLYTILNYLGQRSVVFKNTEKKKR